MTDILSSIKKQAAAAAESGLDLAVLDMGPVRIDSGAIREVAPYLTAKGYRHVSVVSDSITYEIAGGSIAASITDAGIDVRSTMIKPNSQGDVIADEVSIVQLLLDIRQRGSEVVIAAGSGTLHDIARFAAYTTGIPFVSVPTAPSVDGFNSKGAPIIVRGEKITIPSIGPDAIFADLDILTVAPSGLVAAGFGDMLGKYTSLFDWTFGHLAGGEPYSPFVAKLTRNALQRCVDNVDEIAARSNAGIQILMSALLESGFAMLLFGQSHSASGAEHHLSHYWEMEYLKLGRRQLLHGAKVGAACAEISKLYHRLAAEQLPFVTGPEKSRIADEIHRLPDEHAIRSLLRKVGGPDMPETLGIDDELLARSLREAHRIRPNRYTLLRVYNESMQSAAQ
ncbi:sn-glycerol-1-phosphate dehydrogenase [Paenibacillus spongiae]|uniref:Sn-glycerol-1-phosphate dehydrogenase n=1 Tax=Paenibacillus spongiae TaxID=2909671 RepID=A0ABY5SGG9_9BACL|nr:sn-glycerol-1-phosphate dehydrogenase [Paenibacillus spongiae]UVI31812.1 sn-glycerol-1-phosphate dehydrogenase [Paenibacillus spongiae]